MFTYKEALILIKEYEISYDRIGDELIFESIDWILDYAEGLDTFNRDYAEQIRLEFSIDSMYLTDDRVDPELLNAVIEFEAVL